MKTFTLERLVKEVKDIVHDKDGTRYTTTSQRHVEPNEVKNNMEFNATRAELQTIMKALENDPVFVNKVKYYRASGRLDLLADLMAYTVFKKNNLK